MSWGFRAGGGMSKERPILFSGPMVRAILAGRKTETRRLTGARIGGLVSGPGEPRVDHWCIGPGNPPGKKTLSYAWEVGEKPDPGVVEASPYGQPGDLLWVREAFRHYGNESSRDHSVVHASIKYRADGSFRHCGNWPSFREAPQQAWWNTGRRPWSPSIHMPRWAARIFLRVEDIRVERLQEITEEGAKAEGVGDALAEFPAMGNDQRLTSGDLVAEAPHRAMFAILWDEINGDRALWKSDPWVWVVRFSIDESTTAPSGEGSP